MAAKRKGAGANFPKKVRWAAGVVTVNLRSNGMFSLRWRENGVWKRTTRSTEEDAMMWAEDKARRLDALSAEQWVKPAEGEVLADLRRIAGGAGNVTRAWQEIAAAVDRVGGTGKLGAAVDCFLAMGAGEIEEVTVGEAVRRVLLEYELSPAATRATMGTALRGMKRVLGEELRLAAVSREEMEGWVFERGRSKRTVRNRLSQGATFFNRCRVLGMWPAGRPLPVEGMKKPRLDDVAPGIFNPTEGKIILGAVVKECPRYLPYLLLAGWLGCRPSECLRLLWGAVDVKNSLVHLSHKVVGKTNRERWVKFSPAMGSLLERLRGEDDAPICFTRSREELSILAKRCGLEWPADVLRHSAITYELQRSGGDYNHAAEWAGNSPGVIRENYRRPIPAGWGGCVCAYEVSRCPVSQSLTHYELCQERRS